MSLKEGDQRVSSGLRKGPFAGTCEHGNESSGSIVSRQLLVGW